jgi:hypothetical protein
MDLVGLGIIVLRETDFPGGKSSSVGNLTLPPPLSIEIIGLGRAFPQNPWRNEEFRGKMLKQKELYRFAQVPMLSNQWVMFCLLANPDSQKLTCKNTAP